VAASASDCIPTATSVPGALLPVIVFTFILPAGVNIETWIETLCLELFFNFRTQLNTANATYTLTVGNLIVLVIKKLSVTKRDNAFQTAFSIVGNNAAKVLSALSNAAGSQPDVLPGSVSSLEFGFGHVDNNGNLVLASNVPAGTSSTVIVNRTITKSNHKKLTGGQLAGVIIGVFFGAVILTAIILFIIYKRRETYPLPFRSPAAAYRP